MIRTATDADIYAMHAIRVAVTENRLSDPARITRNDYALALGELGRGWVSVESDRVVGFAVGYRTGNIWALFVDPAHEGCGHGRALHDVMIAWLRETGIENAWLTTARGTRAERFYVARGWRVVWDAGGGEVRMEVRMEMRLREDGSER